MQYDDVIAGAFVPTPAGTVAAPTQRTSIARRLRDAIEPIAMHPVWSRQTNDAMVELGLDFFSGYVWGRAAALGEPAPAVVVSSFAVFEPTMISAVYEQGRAACSRDQVLAARMQATTASLRAVLGDADVVTSATRLRNSALDLDQSGRPLYAGLAQLPLPDDPVGVLWRSAEMIREHRGDSHIAACVAEGLDPIAMNILTELWVGMPLGSYSATRGWSEAALSTSADELRNRGLLDGEQLSEAGQAFRDRVEDATDLAQAPLVAALGDGVDELIAELHGWSQRCIDAKAFPPSVHKRAAG